jgi:hypothetical protein
MAGARREVINGGNLCRSFSGCPIPKGGQVAVVLGLVHSSSIFSLSGRAGRHGEPTFIS